LNALNQLGVVGNLSDAQLLDRFLARGEAVEVAFGALVARHGPMVLDVCFNVLRDPHDAQDAFQATFLVLASRARSIRRRESLAGWLYGVAHRVAVRSRANMIRRRMYEKRAAAMRSSREEARPESWPELHEEIARLPEKYREPVVLCYLEGLSTEATAHRLGCPHGTVLSRLARARARIRGGLIRRGWTCTMDLLIPEARRNAPAIIPWDLLEATMRASSGFAKRSASATIPASTEAVSLAREVLTTMMISKLKGLGAAALACTLTVGGMQTFGRQSAGPGETGPTAAAQPKADDLGTALMRSVDRLQAGLEESTRRNAELGEELLHIRKNLQVLRAGAIESASTPDEAVARIVKVLKHDPAQAVSQFVEVLKRYPPRHSSTEGARMQIYMMDLVAGGTTLIADEVMPGLTWCGAPTWSHDGRRIAFDASPGMEWQFSRLMLLEVREGRPAFKDLGPGNCTTFSPDDQRIAFLLNSGAAPGAQEGVWIMQADGTERRRADGFGAPFWSPDGHEFLVNSFPEPTVSTVINLETAKGGTLEVAGHRIFSWPRWAGPGMLVAVIGTGEEGEAIALLDVSKPTEAKIVEVLWKRGADLDLTPRWPLYWPESGRCFFVGVEEPNERKRATPRNRPILSGPAPGLRTLYSVKRGESGRAVRMETGGQDDKIGGLAFSPDGRYLLFGANRPERR
jgi:RNA polymerase sigma factor (sigma-70 family)